MLYTDDNKMKRCPLNYIRLTITPKGSTYPDMEWRAREWTEGLEQIRGPTCWGNSNQWRKCISGSMETPVVFFREISIST